MSEMIDRTDLVIAGHNLLGDFGQDFFSTKIARHDVPLLLLKHNAQSGLKSVHQITSNHSVVVVYSINNPNFRRVDELLKEFARTVTSYRHPIISAEPSDLFLPVNSPGKSLQSLMFI